jgi:hypothetical protein
MATLMSLDLNDTSAKPKIISEGLDNPNAIAKSSHSIYYNSLGGRSISAISLNQPSLFPQLNERHHISDSTIYGQMSLRSVDLDSKRSLPNGCSVSNGQCEHICIVKNEVHKCLCSQGYELHANNRNCILPSNYLVLSSSEVPDDLLRLSTHGPLISSQNSRQMNIAGIRSSPIAIALNPVRS